MILRVSILFLTLVSLLSCDKKRVFDEYHSVGKAWHQDSIVSFELAKIDTTKRYNLFLNVRGNDNYPFSNLFVIVSLEQPGGLTTVDTLEYQMAAPDGTLLGEGFTDVKDSKLVYKENATFKSGTYKVHIRQAARQTGKVAGVERLPGITEVGFRVEKTE